MRVFEGMNGKKLNEIQDIIEYKFKNIFLLQEALTHSSHAKECKDRKMSYNERLEFLGDSIFGLVVSDYIFNKYSDMPEGELTKIRANVVCEASLAERALKIDLGEYMRLGKGEEASGGRQRVSILADAMEAVIGAMYIDGGLDVTRKFVLSTFIENIELAVKGKLNKDYKTHLQELLQSRSKEKITYKVVGESGPDHDKIFEIEVSVGARVLGIGIGKSKKEAEQESAKKALDKTGY
ncbi:MAG: ribonuclease III [Alkaliphilus sp.]